MKFWFAAFALIMIVACNQQSSTQQTNTIDSVADNHDTTIEKPGEAISKNFDLTDTTKAEPFQANKLIVPGKSIGNVEIGMDDSKLEMFGKPDMSDAAMGKAWLTWYGKKRDEHNNKTQLDVYTTYKDTSMTTKTVQQVRTTSSFFETDKGVHVYTSLKDIQQNFIALKKVATYAADGKTIAIYDARQQGIAVEITPVNDQQVCTGIIIHKPGVKVTQVYISLHPDMKVL